MANAEFNPNYEDDFNPSVDNPDTLPTDPEVVSTFAGEFRPFDSFTMLLRDTDPPRVLLGYDVTRVRALLRASGSDVYIGTRDQLSSIQVVGGVTLAPQGFPIASGYITDLYSNQEIFAVYRPATITSATVFVSAWIERAV